MVTKRKGSSEPVGPGAVQVLKAGCATANPPKKIPTTPTASAM